MINIRPATWHVFVFILGMKSFKFAGLDITIYVFLGLRLQRRQFLQLPESLSLGFSDLTRFGQASLADYKGSFQW